MQKEYRKFQLYFVTGQEISGSHSWGEVRVVCKSGHSWAHVSVRCTAGKYPIVRQGKVVTMGLLEESPTLELKLVSRLLQSQHPPRHSAPDPWECCSFRNVLEVRLALPGAFVDMGP